MNRPSRTTIRRAGALTTLLTLGAVGVAGTAGTAQAAPAPTRPSLTVSLSPTVTGSTLHYLYRESGTQHLVRDPDSHKVYDNGESAGYTIYLDGKLVDGGDGLGGSECTTGGVASFANRGKPTTMPLGAPGRHTLKVVAQYCGAAGLTTVTRSYTLTATGTKPAPKPAPKSTATLATAGRYTPGKPLALTGTCSSAKATTATVVGPRGMRATLKPAAGTRTMRGAITVPTALRGSWVRLSMTCSDGAHTTAIATKVGARGPVPKA